MPKAQVLVNYTALTKQAQRAMRKRTEKEKIRIQIGSATCEHAAGSRAVLKEFQKMIAASGRDDIMIHMTGCTGRCSLEPIVGITSPQELPVKYERVTKDDVQTIFTEHIMGGKAVENKVLETGADKRHSYECVFSSRDRCRRQMQEKIRGFLGDKLKELGLSEKVYLGPARCFGSDADEDLGRRKIHIFVRPTGTLYGVQTQEDVERIAVEHLQGGKVVQDLVVTRETTRREFLDMYGDIAFFSRQSRIALRNCGMVDPESMMEYIHFSGFSALTKVLGEMTPQDVVEEVVTSKLRGRGGGGFPTGLKWRMGLNSAPGDRYLICNADEGDPGAFMDRSMLESDPFNVVEGMIIGGYAIQATKGFFYIRAEYPLAIKRIQHAIDRCRAEGLLGKDILGSGFDFDLEIRLGAGAFVCGEETALIHSIEGKRGQPSIRPPYPTESGLFGRPTVINNVETFANISAIMIHGGEWFNDVGQTDKSGGTKVFALAGKIEHTGLVEVPMGTTLREVVFEIGGGVRGGKQLKAIQTGGPAGGCLPAEWIDTKIDYDTLGAAGSIMGSGGMIILDEDDCAVDIAKFFLTFSQDESCGKCTPCREGTKRMLEILERITEGKGEEGDIEKLERLAKLVQRTSLCGLGRAAPNPVLSTIQHFRDEYNAHIRDKKCVAKKCTSLIYYEIDPQKCVGCTLCARKCPVECIDGERREPHVIDQARCIKCGQCFEVCRFDAVARK